MALGRTPAVAALPGGTLLVDRATMATAAPDELAGRLAAALEGDPVRALVEDAGLLADLRYVFSGRFDERTLVRAAESAVSEPSAGWSADPPGLADSDWAALRGICG
jgi:hypothetical protein